jgi:hypothetical protein
MEPAPTLRRDIRFPVNHAMSDICHVPLLTAGNPTQCANRGDGTLSILPKVTNEALEAYCYCLQKFHLTLRGEHGVKSDYEIMRAELRSNARTSVLSRYCKDSELSADLRLTQARLQNAPQYIFDGIYEDKDFKLHIDAIEKVVDTSDPCTYSFRPRSRNPTGTDMSARPVPIESVHALCCSCSRPLMAHLYRAGGLTATAAIRGRSLHRQDFPLPEPDRLGELLLDLLHVTQSGHSRRLSLI